MYRDCWERVCESNEMQTHESAFTHPRLAFRSDALFADKLNNGELHELVLRGHRVVQVVYEIVECAGWSGVDEHGESIALAGRVALCDEEGLDKLWSVGNEMLMLLVDLHDGKDCILANKRVAVFLM